jgi:hypothetical protein
MSARYQEGRPQMNQKSFFSSFSTCFRHAFNSFSQLFAFSCFSLFLTSERPASLRAVKRPLPAKRSGEGWGEGCVLVTSRRRYSDLRHLRGQDEACLSLRAAEKGVPVTSRRRYKPNPKGIFIKCRYSDTKPYSSLKPSAPKNKQFQTIAANYLL